MSTMVCQGLQSCLEPRFVEPRTLGLKMVTTKALFLKPNSLSVSDTEYSDTEEGINNDNINTIFDDNNKNIIITKKDDDLGGWSFIQTLTNSSQNASTNIGAKEDSSSKPAYVHPVYKRSKSQLSNKSLELCTETLGSETGSDIGEEIDFSSDSESNSSKSPTKETSKLRTPFGYTTIKKVNYGSLPPPLTSISGSNCYTIKPHREGGRLVMKAVLTPTPNTYFQAERRDGRLKLHYIKNSESPFTSDSEQEEEETYMDEERNGNAGGEVGMERIQRPSRCKEGRRNNQGLLIWEPFWVAT
ncbi:hypothetical protein ACHQM5_027089 [Ranunculus cassubicifolius]